MRCKGNTDEATEILSKISNILQNQKNTLKTIKTRSILETFMSLTENNNLVEELSNLMYQSMKDSDDLQNYFISRNGFNKIIPFLKIENEKLITNTCKIIILLCSSKCM